MKTGSVVTAITCPPPMEMTPTSTPFCGGTRTRRIARAEMRQDEMLEDFRGDFADIGEFDGHRASSRRWVGKARWRRRFALPLPYAGANRIRCEGSAGLPALSARQRSPSAVQLPETVRARAAFVNRRAIIAEHGHFRRSSTRGKPSCTSCWSRSIFSRSTAMPFRRHAAGMPAGRARTNPARSAST